MLYHFLRTSILFLFFLISLNSQIIRETRAVWVTTNFRLDWPPPTNDSEIQKKELEKIFDNIKSKNLNTIYFQVRSNGTVLFNSEYEPFAFHLVPQREFDPLQFAINEAHKRGLEIHAWVNVVRLFSGTETSILRNPNHIKNKFPYWVKEFRENGALSYWLDMGYPEVRDYLKNEFIDLIKNYNIDGLHFDFIRYPGKNFDDNESFSLYGAGINKDDWRRRNINLFVEDIYKSAKSINPLIKIGSAPIGIYENIGSLRGFEGYNDVYQDARYWLKAGIMDYIVPQVYWSFGGAVPFENISLDWLKNKYNRQVIIGTAAYKSEVKTQLNRMIDFTRENNSDGIAFFRYENIKDINFAKFEEKAFPVEYPWIKKNEPLAPTNLTYSFVDNMIQLNWTKPGNSNSVFYYGLFNKDELIELFPSEISSIKFKSISNKYVLNLHLKSIDKAWNESVESSNSITIKNPILSGFYNSVFDPEARPILLKTNNNFYISLISLANDNLLIEFENSINNSITTKITRGRNIIKLSSNAAEAKEIKLKFTNSGRSISLYK